MARTPQNNRCPLQAECERKCTFKLRELECDYYKYNARPDYYIKDQEAIRQKQERAEDEKLEEAMIAEIPDEEELDEEESNEEAEETTLYTSKASIYLDGPRGVTEKIKQAMYNAAKEFVYIGFLLWEVQKNGYYREHGYNNVYEYAETELNFKRSSTKNFIAIAEQFGTEDRRSIGGIAHTRTMMLQPKYEQFNYSQLCEMLSMAPAKREQVTPDMTVREIRELKRQSEPDLPPELETIPIELPEKTTGQTSGQENKTIIINNYWRDLPPEIIKAIVKAAGLKYTPKSCYKIRVERKEAEAWQDRE